jgi:predicted TIM-barrel fold metal-dependent hydrolase
VTAGRLFVGCEGDEPTLAHASELIGSEAFVYSSDYPHEVNNEICKHEIHEMLECEDLTDADKENILHRNAERFYNLQAAPAASSAAAAAAR